MAALGGQRALWFGWEEGYAGRLNTDYLDDLDVGLAPADDADFVLCQGSQLIYDGTSATPTELLHSGRIGGALEDALRTCARRRLPMVCANPDLYVTLGDGSRGHMPGLIASRYEELLLALPADNNSGGRESGETGAAGSSLVTYYGKPYAAAFDACISRVRADVGASARILHVGDSLAHDVAGAAAAGIDSLFVTGACPRRILCLLCRSMVMIASKYDAHIDNARSDARGIIYTRSGYVYR